MIRDLLKELEDSKAGKSTYDKYIVTEMTLAFLMGALERMEGQGTLSEEVKTYVKASLEYGIKQASNV